MGGALDVPQRKASDASDKEAGKDLNKDNACTRESAEYLGAEPGNSKTIDARLAFAVAANMAKEKGTSFGNNLTINDSSNSARPGSDNSNKPRDLNALSSVQADGSRCSYELITKPDGSSEKRITERIGRDGSTRTYKYDTSDSTTPSKIIDRTRSSEGKLIEQVRENKGNSRYELTEYEVDGLHKKKTRTETEINVEVRPDGKVAYELPPQNSTELMLKLALGQQKLIAGDYHDAREHLINVFREHGGTTNIAYYMDKLIARNHKRKEDGYKAATDDQLAKTFRNLASIYETNRTGAAGQLSMGQVNTRVVDALQSLGMPKKYNNQGQVGSCYLNALLNVAEYLHPDKVSATFAKIMTKGEWRNHKYNVSDLSAKNGRDTFNNMMTNALASTFGFNHIGRGFRGTTDPEAKHAYKAMTGTNLPQGRGGLRKYGIATNITMGGAHAQSRILEKVDGREKTYQDNTWNGYREGYV